MIDVAAFDGVLLRSYRLFGPRYAPKREVLALLFQECEPNDALALFDAVYVERGDEAALTSEGLRFAAEASERETVGSLAAVTRRFLEDVLAEAGLPPELIDVIVDAYGENGAITMSEDGGRYIVHLARNVG